MSLLLTYEALLALLRGLKRGHGDTRAGSFLSLLSHLQQMCRPPDYLLLENVVGFEVSETHAEMLRILESCGYVSQVCSWHLHLKFMSGIHVFTFPSCFNRHSWSAPLPQPHQN